MFANFSFGSLASFFQGSDTTKEKLQSNTDLNSDTGSPESQGSRLRLTRNLKAFILGSTFFGGSLLMAPLLRAEEQIFMSDDINIEVQFTIDNSSMDKIPTKKLIKLAQRNYAAHQYEKALAYAEAYLARENIETNPDGELAEVLNLAIYSSYNYATHAVTSGLKQKTSYQNAQNYITQALELDPTNDELIVLRKIIKRKLNPDGEHGDFNTFILNELQGGESGAGYWLAKLIANQDNPELCASHGSEYLNLTNFPLFGAQYLTLNCLVAVEQFAAAKDIMVQFETHPNFIWNPKEWSDIYWKIGEYNSSIRLLNQWKIQDPDANPIEFKLTLAYLYLQLGQTDLAISHSKAAEESLVSLALLQKKRLPENPQPRDLIPLEITLNQIAAARLQQLDAHWQNTDDENYDQAYNKIYGGLQKFLPKELKFNPKFLLPSSFFCGYEA